MNIYEVNMRKELKDKSKVKFIDEMETAFNNLLPANCEHNFVVCGMDSSVSTDFRVMIYVSPIVHSNILSVFDEVTEGTNRVWYGLNEQGFYFLIRKKFTQQRRLFVYSLTSGQLAKYKTFNFKTEVVAINNFLEDKTKKIK